MREGLLRPPATRPHPASSLQPQTLGFCRGLGQAGAGLTRPGQPGLWPGSQRQQQSRNPTNPIINIINIINNKTPVTHAGEFVVDVQKAQMPHNKNNEDDNNKWGSEGPKSESKKRGGGLTSEVQFRFKARSEPPRNIGGVW